MLNGSLTLSDLNILRGHVFNDMGCELRNQSMYYTECKPKNKEQKMGEALARNKARYLS